MPLPGPPLRSPGAALSVSVRFFPPKRNSPSRIRRTRHDLLEPYSPCSPWIPLAYLRNKMLACVLFVFARRTRQTHSCFAVFRTFSHPCLRPRTPGSLGNLLYRPRYRTFRVSPRDPPKQKRFCSRAWYTGGAGRGRDRAAKQARICHRRHTRSMSAHGSPVGKRVCAQGIPPRPAAAREPLSMPRDKATEAA